jgi:hypothetical protein
MATGDDRTYFGSLEQAVEAWGKWVDESWKIIDARSALDRLVTMMGSPSTRGGATEDRGRKPYYIPSQSWQYVAITWDGEMGLQLQKGFMQAVRQIGPEWQLTDRVAPANQREKWYKRPFPDHVTFGPSAGSGTSKVGECRCSPGMKQPVGLPCSYCEEIVEA